MAQPSSPSKSISGVGRVARHEASSRRGRAAPLLPLLRHLLSTHQVGHLYDLGWGGKKDRFVYADAQRRGYDAILTNNWGQLNDPDECTAIQRSGLHWIAYTLDDGLDGLGAACAAVAPAIRTVVDDLASLKSQHLVTITALARRKRHVVINPSTNPPSAYWPTTGGRGPRR